MGNIQKANSLNKKLADWAGFRIDVDDGEFYYGTRVKYIYPDGEWDEFMPDFTNSLDACFKWLVTDGGYDDSKPLKFKLGFRMDVIDGIYMCWVNYPNSPAMKYGHDKESLALALCLAIEKLIDSEQQEVE